MYVISVTEVKQILKSVCNRHQSHKASQRHPICLPESDHDFILDETKLRDTIEYKRDMSVDDNYYQFT